MATPVDDGLVLVSSYQSFDIANQRFRESDSKFPRSTHALSK